MCWLQQMIEIVRRETSVSSTRKQMWNYMKHIMCIIQIHLWMYFETF